MSDHPPSSLLVESPSATFVAIGVGAFLNGAMAGWVAQVFDQTYFNLRVEVWAFLVVWAATTAYFSYRRIPSGVVGVSLYVLGIFIVLVPIAEYAPLIVTAMHGSGGFDTTLFIEGVTGLLTWGTVAGITAAVVAFVSKRLTRRADRIYRRSMQTRWREDVD